MTPKGNPFMTEDNMRAPLHYSFAEKAASRARGEWPCGHPRTSENTQAIGEAGIRCRTCRRTIAREWARKARLRQAILEGK